MTIERIAPEVHRAAARAGVEFAEVKVTRPTSMAPNGRLIVVDATVVTRVRLQHYDDELKLLLVEVLPHWIGGFALAGLEDGSAFVAHVRPVTRVKMAIHELVPREVIEAQLWRKPVTRQGDWFFFPEDRPRQVTIHRRRPLDDDHVADRVAVEKARGRTYVFGRVTHREHPIVTFERWHRAVRNRAIRVNRLGAD